MEKLPIRQTEITTPLLGLLLETNRVSETEYCLLFTQGVLVYNKQDGSMKSEKFKQQLVGCRYSEDKIEVFCKNGEIFEIDTATFKRTPVKLEGIKKTQIVNVSISRVQEFVLIETNNCILLLDSELKLIKNYPMHSFNKVNIREVWSKDDTYFCLLDGDKNLCVYKVLSDEIFYLTHEESKIYSFHWDKKVEGHIFLGKLGHVEIFDIDNKEIVDIIEGYSSPVSYIDSQPQLGLIAFQENNKIMTTNYKKHSSMIENNDNKLKNFIFGWIEDTYYLIIQDLITRDFFLLDPIEKRILEFRIKHNKPFDSVASCGFECLIFQFRSLLIVINVKETVIQRINQLEENINSFLTQKISIPHFIDEKDSISDKIQEVFVFLKKTDRAIRGMEFILEMCDKNFGKVFPITYSNYINNPVEYLGKYNGAKHKLIVLLQIEIESIKDFIAEKEKDVTGFVLNDLLSVKKGMYLLQLLYINMTKTIDKDTPDYSFPNFDLDDFIY